ncbi:MAG: DUF1987 domain-containing protein [Bacteroidales bacterium]|jgi:hypothetical protein|nr:DUF1987 domain-containing protein [Bacteroidales bacterium]
MKEFLNHKGQVTHKSIDRLLSDLKKTEEYRSLNKTTAKRAYSILVEILENISKHSICKSYSAINAPCTVSVSQAPEKIIINAGNPISNEKRDILAAQLELVNNLDQVALVSLYEDKINRKAKKNERNAGLGFLLMRIKSGNRIEYSFSKIAGNIWYFSVKILINKYIMRKLLIERTASSPRVLLDPENNVFEISGESRPSDVAYFYGEIITWYDDYSLALTRLDKDEDPPVFNLDFDYFNSSSAKYILDLCKMMASTRTKGKEIKVKWHYEKDDMDMLESGKEMSRISKMPFEFVEKG